MIAKDTPFVASYSGGKDSTLALWRAVRAGARPLALLTMLDETGERSRSHGVSPAVLDAQAALLGLPRISGHASWGARERWAQWLRCSATSTSLRTGNGKSRCA